MPVAFFALLLPPLLQCLHFPVSGPCPRSPFSLLTLLPSLIPISLLTSLPSLRPHPVIPASPAGTQQQRPLSVHRPFMVSLSNHIPAASLPPDAIRGGDPAASNHPSAPSAHGEPFEPHPVHAAPRDPQTSDSPAHGEPVLPHPTVPSTTPAKAPIQASSHRTPNPPEKRPVATQEFFGKNSYRARDPHFHPSNRPPVGDRAKSCTPGRHDRR